MAAPRSSAFQEISIDNQLLIALEQEAPYGYWICHVPSGEVMINNALSVSIGIDRQASDDFKANTLGAKQFNYCQEIYRKGAVNHFQLSYASNKDFLNFEVEQRLLENYPDFFVALHLFAPQNPWQDDQLYYPYLIKIDREGKYLYHNSLYVEHFFADKTSRIGESSMADVAEQSRETGRETAHYCLAHPGLICNVRIEKKNPRGPGFVSTHWQFISFPDCYGDVDVIYARGFDISALQAAEEQLDARQKELNFFFENQMIGVFFMMLPEPQEWNENTDKDAVVKYAFENQVITRCNKMILDQYGFKSEEEFLNLSPRDFFLHDIEGGLKVWRNFFENGHLHNLTEERRTDGELIKIEGDYLLLRDEKDRIVGHLGLQQDVTEREAEKARSQAHREQLEKLTESIPGVVFQVDYSPNKRLNLSFLSKAFEAVNFGIERQKLLEDPSSIMQVISPKDYSTLLGSVVYSARNLQDLDAEFRIENKLGEERWFRIRVRPQSKHDSQSSWYGILTAIDDQKAFEKEQHKLALIARNTSDLIMIVSQEGRVDWVNSACVEFFGWKPDFALGKEPDQLFRSQENRKQKEDLLIALYAQRSIELKVKLEAEEGARWLNVRNKPIWNANGEFLYSLLVMQDIHEEEVKNQEMEALLNITSEQNKRLQSFTYIVSHNIRSHSANLQGLIEAVDAAKTETEKLELWEYLRKVSDGLESTIKHLNEIIAINQSLNRSKSNLCLKEEVQRILDILGAELKALNAKVELDFKPEAEVYSVKAYLESILLNLLSNTLRYRHPDREPRINIRLSENRDFHILEVKDNGLGIDLKRYKDRLFQLY
ncbi:PAS domain S-box protein [Croceimicrobium sp.]|uniref:PAS domain-containing sensor histidine kinase n=1 Tax=Croceimicrobium sp. TaxID=2828340 RepID=UPI003BAD4D2C